MSYTMIIVKNLFNSKLGTYHMTTWLDSRSFLIHLNYTVYCKVTHIKARTRP